MLRFLVVIIFCPLHLPHILIYYVSSKRSSIKEDLKRYTKDKDATAFELLESLTFIPEFRALFYYRIGVVKYFIRWIHPVFINLYFLTSDIGDGLRIQHGFATVIAAKKMGKNCWINQQVTIGYTNNYDCPVIGDNVTINAGAIVIGDITIGDNVIIGAGAVVTKSVPPNCTVVGNPARIVRKEGNRVDIKL